MTLTPRYIPGTPLADIDAETTIDVGVNGWGIATHEVPDAPRITPFYLNAPRNSNRNTINLSVNLNPGIAIDNIRSASHQINVDSPGEAVKKIQLRGGHSILDRDFELEWPDRGLTEIARPPEKPLQSQPIANHLPAGQSAPALMYPQTATSANLNFYLGLLALMLVLVVRRGLGDA